MNRRVFLSAVDERRFSILILGIVAIFTISLTLLISHSNETRRGTDDAYITYQYAKNIADGNGFVFNVGDQRALGTSTPLYAGLLALGARLGISIPLLSIGIGILATSAALSLVVCIAWEFGFLSAGLVVGLTASVAQLYWRWEGMETPLYLALILSSIWTAFRGWGSVGVSLAAAATITRLDGLAVLVAVGLFLALDRRWSWRTIAPGAGLLASWLIIATLLFGSPVPTSGVAKMLHDRHISGRFSVASPDFVNQVLPITRLIPASAFSDHRSLKAVFCGLFFMILVACVALLRPRRLVTLLALWLVFYLGGYQLLRLPDFEWYYGPPAIVLALFLWMGLQAAVRFGTDSIHWPGRLVAPAASWTIAIAMLVVLIVGTPLYTTNHSRRDSAHVLAARWLRQHATPGDTVVAYEIGALAYLSGLRTIDLLGLTDPDTRVHLRAGDFAWAIRELPTYVFSGERPVSSIWPVTAAIFAECAFVLNYRPAVRVPLGDVGDYVIYRRAYVAEGKPSGGRWAAEWLDMHHPTSMRSGSTTAYSVSVRNLSTAPWHAHTRDAPFLTYEWRDEHGAAVVSGALRTFLPCDVGPGQRALLSAAVRSPKRPGAYILSWHLMRESSDDVAEHEMVSAGANVIVY
jgi:arabinofuranosyltransferase